MIKTHQIIKNWNQRKKLLLSLFLAIFYIFTILVLSHYFGAKGEMNMSLAGQSPNWQHPFGTDTIGRDVFQRTVLGLSRSLRIGLLATGLSIGISIILTIGTALRLMWLDEFIGLFVDVGLGIPHLIFMLLISASLGGGTGGVVVAICATHWIPLTRVLRAEIMSLQSKDYVLMARNFGKSPLYILWQHLFRHIFPHILVKGCLLFPHAILHEAALTFLGFGLSPLEPAIGVMLNDSAQYLYLKMWWCILFPGLGLFLTVICFENVAESLRVIFHAKTSQQ